MAYTPVHSHAFDSSAVFSFPAENDGFARSAAAAAPHVVSSENSSQTFPPGDGTDPHKDYADVDLREVNPAYWTAIHGAGAGTTAPPPHHQRGWSDSTIAARGAEFDDLDTTTAAASSKFSAAATAPKTQKHRRGSGTPPMTESWTLEAAVGATLGVLARFNGRALPDWPYDITLNALLVTVATAGVGVALGQLKWVRFRERRAPPADMERFDEASRGTWGAVKLLGTGRGGYLGAVVAIAALGLSPFAQQVVTYQTRTVETPEGASVNRALNYTDALPRNTSSSMHAFLLHPASYPSCPSNRPSTTGGRRVRVPDGELHETLGRVRVDAPYCASSPPDCGWPRRGLLPDASRAGPPRTRLVFMGSDAAPVRLRPERSIPGFEAGSSTPPSSIGLVRRPGRVHVHVRWPRDAVRARDARVVRDAVRAAAFNRPVSSSAVVVVVNLTYAGAVPCPGRARAAQSLRPRPLGLRRRCLPGCCRPRPREALEEQRVGGAVSWAG
ncbi:hypothetical protein F4775DRAFT_591769 [Biscogniauxia sp. FL1348]|nr:hypothetical protein F4775DRAFT_591769 [Biscogniauxia sp. FL1348]